MMNEDQPMPTFLTSRKSKKNRQTKTQLVFDEQARKDYLKGFHKRKLERRERAQKELEDEIKTDLKNLRQKRRDEMKKKHEALGLLDTVEVNPKKRTIELKNHTIEISEMDEQLTSNPGIFMGHAQSQLEEAPEEDEEDASSSRQKKPKRPLSQKMSILQNMKAPSAIRKGHQTRNKPNRGKPKLGKNGGIQTPSKKKRTQQ